MVRVLVVDDNGETREAYAECLSQQGWDYEAVGNGEEALRVAPTYAPHAILMDLSMPGLDGFEATRRLKSDERTRHIPIVALTAFARKAHDALAAGCDEFLTKPCLARDLVAVLEKVIQGA
jgi:CheY-like chemotaxis protein